MATLSKMMFRAPLPEVVASLRSFYRKKHLITTTVSEEPESSKAENFRAHSQRATLFSVIPVGEHVEVHYNCLFELDDLCQHLSEAFQCDLVVNLYDEEAVSGYWAVYTKGEEFRSLEFEAEQLTKNRGLSMEFENDPPGHAEEEEDQENWVFNGEDMEEYNRGVGVPLPLRTEATSTWTHLFLVRKVWWKIWQRFV